MSVHTTHHPRQGDFPDLVPRKFLPVHLYHSRNGAAEQSEPSADTERSKGQREMAAQKAASIPAPREMATPHGTLTEVLIFPGPARL